MPIYIDQDYNYNNDNLTEKSSSLDNEFEGSLLSEDSIQDNKLSAGWIDKNQFAYKEFLKLKGAGFAALRT